MTYLDTGEAFYSSYHQADTLSSIPWSHLGMLYLVVYMCM